MADCAAGRMSRMTAGAFLSVVVVLMIIAWIAIIIGNAQ